MAVRLKQTMNWTCDACGEKHQDILEVGFEEEWSEALAPEGWHPVQRGDGEWMFFCPAHTLILQASTKGPPVVFELKRGVKKISLKGGKS